MLLKIGVIVLLGILLLGLMISPPAHSASLQCDYPGIDQAGLIANARFNVDLPQFGAVCFMARRTTYPEYSETDYIEFELFQDGKLVYTMPRAQRFLWVGGCNILAVGFPKLDNDGLKSVIVLGRCPTARDELMQPLIFLPGESGFKVDADLSLKTTNLDTIAKVVTKVKKLLAQRRNRTKQ